MSNDLQLFRVTVTQTWSADGEALVWAEDRHAAEAAAKCEVELDHLDADDEGTDARARPEALDVLEKLGKDPDEWLILPISRRPGKFTTATTEEFLAFMSPEQSERIRLAWIERNNGQLALLEAGS